MSGPVSGLPIDYPHRYCEYSPTSRRLPPRYWVRVGALFHYRHFVYDAVFGRRLQQDPVGVVDGMNLCENCEGGAVGGWRVAKVHR